MSKTQALTIILVYMELYFIEEYNYVTSCDSNHAIKWPIRDLVYIVKRDSIIQKIILRDLFLKLAFICFFLI